MVELLIKAADTNWHYYTITKIGNDIQAYVDGDKMAGPDIIVDDDEDDEDDEDSYEVANDPVEIDEGGE